MCVPLIVQGPVITGVATSQVGRRSEWIAGTRGQPTSGMCAHLWTLCLPGEATTERTSSMVLATTGTTTTSYRRYVYILQLYEWVGE